MDIQATRREPLKPLTEWLASKNGLSPEQMREFLRSLAVQLDALHQQGELHGELTVGAVAIHDGLPRLGRAAPRRAGERLELSGEQLPPELRNGGKVAIPRSLNEASQILSRAGEAYDARRIDVYQLGLLMIHVATEASLDDYFQRPLVSAKIPAGMRKIIDRAIGTSSKQRLVSCAELLAELDSADALPQTRAVPARETPSRGIAISSDTDRIRLAENQLRREAPSAELPFEKLGSYKIVARLGSGGMGDVFKGYDASLDRYVAIKVLPPEFARREGCVSRFRAEAAAAARVEHPNIVPIYTIDADQDRHFFAMQLIDGPTLGQLLARQPKLPEEQALRIFEQVVGGVAAAHRRGLVHRDIKPGNILLADGGKRALVADFGLVKSISQGNRMTATGVVMGTADYISPEQGRGKSVDGRSDLYSLGVLLYQLLAGRLPFSAESPTSMIFQHAYEPPPPLALMAPQVSPVLAKIVHRLLAKAPEDRYQTCEDLLEDLAAYRTGKPLPHLTQETPTTDFQPSPAIPAAPRPPRTAIIHSPKIDEFDRPLPPIDSSLLIENRGGSLKQRVLNWVSKQAPELASKLLDTQQQVDVAIADYQQRCASLGKLVQEAREVQNLLEKEQREAEAANDPSAAEFQQQVAQQRTELELMQLELARGTARLASLQSQRDALQLRLKAAESRYGAASGRPQNKKRLIRWAVVGGALLIAAAIAILFFLPPLRREAAQQTPAPQADVQPAASSLPAVGPPSASPAVAVSNPTLETGLMHHWSFDENSGDSAKDPLGGNEVVLGYWGKGSPAWAKGKTGHGLQFSTPDDIATSAKYVDYRQLTISFWLNVKEESGINPRLAHPWVDLNYEHQQGVGVMGIVVERSRPPLGQWLHYAALIDQSRSTARIYRDGEEVAAGNLGTYESRQDNKYWAFGHNQDPRNSQDTLNGMLDDVRIYNRLLSQQEVRKLFHAGGK